VGCSHLANAISTLAKLEKARTGYLLLEQLVELDTNDLDNLSTILSEWSISDAKKVLNEIEWRVKIVIQMESKIHDESVDELHQLQPLFDRGLWVLGFEYDSIEFSSNRELSTVLRNLFDQTDISRIRQRPDFVVISRESSLSVLSRKDMPGRDRFKVAGFQSVLILELKKPNIPISYDQIDQAKSYAREIRKHVQANTTINCYVLGSSVDKELDRDNIQEGNIHIYPTEYSLIVGQAKTRLFRLRDEISSFDYMIEPTGNSYQTKLLEDEEVRTS
jgi:hypothetical protein